LYGSGEADVLFFDMAIDKLNSNDINTRRGPLKGNDEPLLQSAGVRRKLKTIVPPEPFAGDLPEQTNEMRQAVAYFTATETMPHQHMEDDDISVISTSSAGSYSGRSVLSGGSRSVLSCGAHVTRKNKEESPRYVYPTFPETLDQNLYGMILFILKCLLSVE
jgi:hypothetical protein